jgi:hypothetical protein
MSSALFRVSFPKVLFAINYYSSKLTLEQEILLIGDLTDPFVVPLWFAQRHRLQFDIFAVLN